MQLMSLDVIQPYDLVRFRTSGEGQPRRVGRPAELGFPNNRVFMDLWGLALIERIQINGSVIVEESDLLRVGSPRRPKARSGAQMRDLSRCFGSVAGSYVQLVFASFVRTEGNPSLIWTPTRIALGSPTTTYLSLRASVKRLSGKCE